jgi:ligand-binding sensor domain-containing protein
MLTERRVVLIVELIVFLVTSDRFLNAQQLVDKPNIDLITVSDGLPFNASTAILQDKAGFIWISSHDGLARYDGYSFLKITGREFLPNNTIFTIAEDKNGFLWIGHLAGYVTKLDPRTMKTWSVQIVEGRDTDVFKIHCDQKGKVWASVRSVGLFLFNGKDKFDFVSALPGLPTKGERTPSSWYNNISSFYEEGDTLWLGSGNGLHQLLFSNMSIRKISSLSADENFPLAVQCLEKMGDQLWMGTYGHGLIKFDPKKNAWKEYTFQKGPRGTTNIVNAISIKDEDELWIASNGKGIGVFNIKTEKFNFYYEPDDFDTGPLCNTLFEDRSGIIWATADKGLFKWNTRENKFLFSKVVTLRSDNGAFYGVSDILTVEHPHRTLVGTTLASGLYIIDENGKVEVRDFKILPQAEPFMLVNDLFQDSNGKVWVVTRDFIYTLTSDNRLSPEVNINKLIPTGEVPHYLRMIETSTGDLWVASLRHGVFVKTKNSSQWKQITSQENKLKDNRVTRLLEDDDHRIWIVHPSSGITRYNLGTGLFDYLQSGKTNSTGLISNRVTDIAKASDGKVWVSTVEGISIFDRKSDSIKNLTEDNGLPSQVVYSICPDIEKNIWATTSKGLIAILPSDEVRSFDYVDGVKGISATLGLRKGEGNFLHMVTYQGYYTFDPAKVLQPDLMQSPLFITGVRNMDKSRHDLQSKSIIEINYFENTVSFEFAALNYRNPQRNKYVYKMDGLDNQWTATSDHVVNYAGLPSGDYTFRVRLDGQSANNEAVITIVVTNPFWKKSWFVALVIIIFSGTVFALYRLRLSVIRKEERAKSELKEKLSEVEMKALRAQMSPHFIFNSLNSINRYIVKSDPETASLYLTKFSKLMRLILDNSNHKIITLEQELSALKLYIELEAMRFNNKFKHTLTISDKVSPGSMGVPPMVIQPFIENAIWHGLLHKNSPGLLEIKIDSFGQGIQCIILDNGVGRKKARELKSKSISKDKSYGMHITAERLRMSNDSNLSAVEIIDLEDQEGNALGTQVILKIVVAELEPEF